MAIWRETELKALLAKLLRSDKLHTSAAFTAGAVAFALANLLLAHHLRPAVYGVVALMVAIIAVGGPLAPLGLAIMVVRNRTPADHRMLLYCAGTSTLVAIVSAAVGVVAYALTPAEVMVVAIAVGSAGFVPGLPAFYKARSVSSPQRWCQKVLTTCSWLPHWSSLPWGWPRRFGQWPWSPSHSWFWRVRCGKRLWPGRRRPSMRPLRCGCPK